MTPATAQSGVGGHTSDPGGFTLQQAATVAESLLALGFDVRISASPGRSEPVRPPAEQEVPWSQASVHVPTTRWTSLELGRFSDWIAGNPELDVIGTASNGEFMVVPPRT